jgi:hypothetical protein
MGISSVCGFPRRRAPFLIMHGDKDNLVLLTDSERLYNALAKVGMDAGFCVVEGEDMDLTDTTFMFSGQGHGVRVRVYFPAGPRK